MIFVVFVLLEALATSLSLSTATAAVTALQLETQAWKGDWDEIFERGTIRIVVPYSRTLFFNDRGSQMGLTADAIHEFQRWLNNKYKARRRPITVLPITTTVTGSLRSCATAMRKLPLGI